MEGYFTFELSTFPAALFEYPDMLKIATEIIAGWCTLEYGDAKIATQFIAGWCTLEYGDAKIAT